MIHLFIFLFSMILFTQTSCGGGSPGGGGGDELAVGTGGGNLHLAGEDVAYMSFSRGFASATEHPNYITVSLSYHLSEDPNNPCIPPFGVSPPMDISFSIPIASLNIPVTLSNSNTTLIVGTDFCPSDFEDHFFYQDDVTSGTITVTTDTSDLTSNTGNVSAEFAGIFTDEDGLSAEIVDGSLTMPLRPPRAQD